MARYLVRIDHKDYVFVEKWDNVADELYYEVYKSSTDETNGQYIGDFDTDKELISNSFLNEFREWLN